LDLAQTKSRSGRENKNNGNMTYHPEEFIGRELEIKAAKNSSLTGMRGTIIGETKKSFTIKTADSEEKTILKNGCTFIIEGSEIEGNQIELRPEERIKHKR
jgi:RNase P/RNase MRP subunit p29